jgi:hypothetical protein
VTGLDGVQRRGAGERAEEPRPETAQEWAARVLAEHGPPPREWLESLVRAAGQASARAGDAGVAR